MNTVEHGPPRGLVAHAAIDKAIRALMASFDDDARASDVAPRFDAFSRLLRSHLADEEEQIASFAETDPEDAVYLLAEHTAFRTSLDELAGKASAGTLSLEDVRRLRIRLSLHEAHEETGLYRWMGGLRAP